MRAALLTKPRQLTVVDDWPEPELTPESVMVELTGLGICGSDLALWSGRRAPTESPWIVGHEGIGQIVQVGDAVSGRAVGDRVVIEPNYPCGRCPACQAGRTSTCPTRGIVGINVPGFLRERVAVPSKFAWAAPSEISDEDLVCTEPLAVARSAAKASGVGPGDRCLVIGAGSQGLLLCQLAVALGVHVSVIEPHAGRLELAERIGATPASPDDQPYPFVFETSGSGEGIRNSVELVEPGGTIVLIGIPHTDIPISIAKVVREQVHVIGSLIYDHPGDFQDTIGLLAAQTVAPSEILRPPSDFASVSDAMADASKLAGKSWISF
ncbi:MAG: alcohol dehydrogenase catalytic domain-containing protein [Solirubrobacteraceae bacterium]